MHSLKLPDDSGQRRRLSRWAALHAWKLAGSTALVTFIGFFMPVALSLVLRPTRSYFFPLLSDVDKYQPEGAILRTAFVAATALLFATTTASVLHCKSLRLFARERTSTDLDPLADLRYEDDSDGLHAHVRRRSFRFTSLQILILAPLSLTLGLTFLQYSGLSKFVYNTVDRQLLIKAALYILSTTWAFAMCFLVWYFLKLQNMPDRVHSELPLDSTSETSSSIESLDATCPTNPSLLQRLKAIAAWCVVILRPICLTGQVVCVIKIVGLWLALDTFSIANIRLVKITLLAALAFAEYTAAFFFAFFMTILAVDMRSKASPTDLLPQTQSPLFSQYPPAIVIKD